MTITTLPLPTAETVPEWAVYWFARLELALRRGDLTDATTALAELSRRGFIISFPALAPNSGKAVNRGR